MYSYFFFLWCNLNLIYNFNTFSACHQNRTIYDVLNLESRVNVSEVLTFANNRNLQDALDDIRKQLNFEGTISILPDEAKRKLAELAESSPTIPFDTYTEVVIPVS